MGESAVSGPHRLHAEDGDYSLQIVGENMQAHLGSDLSEGPCQEMGGAHPRLDRPEWVFDRLPSDVHVIGLAVEALLHGVDHCLMLPSLDARLRAGSALGFQRARYACGSHSDIAG